jgi:hypothetical protein
VNKIKYTLLLKMKVKGILVPVFAILSLVPVE